MSICKYDTNKLCENHEISDRMCIDCILAEISDAIQNPSACIIANNKEVVEMCKVDDQLNQFEEGDEEYLTNFPEGITNGDVMKTLFPVKIITQYSNPFGDTFMVFTLNDEDQQVSLDWWNAPYKRKSINERTESL